MTRIKSIQVILQQELTLALRQPILIFAPVGFVFISLLIFVLGLEPSPQELHDIFPALTMTLSLLSALLTTDQLFKPLFRSKEYTHILLGGFKVKDLVWVKVIWHWCITGLPSLIASPILALMLYLNGQEFLVLFLVLLTTTMILSFWAVFCGAITSDSTQGQMVAPILILPMVIPTLICATMALRSAMNEAVLLAFFALLVANLLVLVLLIPWVVTKVIEVIWRG